MASFFLFIFKLCNIQANNTKVAPIIIPITSPTTQPITANDETASDDCEEVDEETLLGVLLVGVSLLVYAADKKERSVRK